MLLSGTTGAASQASIIGRGLALRTERFGVHLGCERSSGFDSREPIAHGRSHPRHRGTLGALHEGA